MQEIIVFTLLNWQLASLPCPLPFFTDCARFIYHSQALFRIIMPFHNEILPNHLDYAVFPSPSASSASSGIHRTGTPPSISKSAVLFLATSCSFVSLTLEVEVGSCGFGVIVAGKNLWLPENLEDGSTPGKEVVGLWFSFLRFQELVEVPKTRWSALPFQLLGLGLRSVNGGCS